MHVMVAAPQMVTTNDHAHAECNSCAELDQVTLSIGFCLVLRSCPRGPLLLRLCSWVHTPSSPTCASGPHHKTLRSCLCQPQSW
jgi:hypothetical protein